VQGLQNNKQMEERKEHTMTIQEHVPVLIVGAGGAGLSLSLLLHQQGIASMLVERRPEVSWVPRARNLNFRTLEVFRGLQLADEVRAAGTSTAQSCVIFKESLASNQEKAQDLTEGLFQHLETISPDPFGWYCPQSCKVRLSSRQVYGLKTGIPLRHFSVSHQLPDPV
jgi:hypothetical protein